MPQTPPPISVPGDQFNPPSPQNPYSGNGAKIQDDGSSALLPLLPNRRSSMITPTSGITTPNGLSGPNARSKSTRLSDEYPGEYLKHHPLTLILCTLWGAYTVALIVMLHKAAYAVQRNPALPWRYRVLPTIMQTLFAQAHLGITAAYLSRLAVAALHLPYASPPLSWAELFWQADKKWTNPAGIAIVLLEMRKLKPVKRLSSLFLAFTSISIIATLTPTFLERGYPIESVETPVVERASLMTLSKDRLESLGAYQQSGVGGGMWASGLAPMDLFNSSIYVAAGVIREPNNASEYFFASPTFSRDAYITGVKMQGGCKALDWDPTLYSSAFWSGPCGDKKYVFKQGPTRNPALGIYGSMSVDWCSTKGMYPGFLDDDSGSSGTVSALLWINATNTTAQDPVPTSVQGFIQCNSTWTTGNALVHGRNMTFQSFEPFDVTPGAQNAWEMPNHPLNSALELITRNRLSGAAYGGVFGDEAILTMMGYTPVVDDIGKAGGFTQPSLDEMAKRIWWGTGYTAISLISVSRDPHDVDTTLFVTTAARRITYPYVYVAWGLIAGWGFSILCLTIVLFRPSISDGLDAYAATRLVLDHPELVQGMTCGTMADNRVIMSAPFQRVGDVRPNDNPGRIGSGGERLSTLKVYG